MNLFQKIFGSNKKEDAKISSDDVIEAGACPNCWGHYEYDNKFFEYVEDQTRSNINNDKQNRKAFIAQFVETHVTGIRLQKDRDKLVCPKCSGKFG